LVARSLATGIVRQRRRLQSQFARFAAARICRRTARPPDNSPIWHRRRRLK